MKTLRLICSSIGLIFALQPVALVAMETDQYNLPPVALADIGDEVSEHIEENLRAAVAKVNADIASNEACLGAGKMRPHGCGGVDEETNKLKYLRSNDAISKELYKLLGDGNIFVSYIGRWMNSHEFHGSPSRYKTGYFESIYATEPIDYMTLSPTVRMFGTEFGTDKLDHFFQQGYKYYTIRKDAISKGLTRHEAAKKAVKWGQMTERTYFGLLISGVYSNADLYANYAGMKFYEGLTEAISVGDQTRPAILVLKDGKWNIADGPKLHDNLLKPFISGHLNEAFNPSSYGLLLFPAVRRTVKKNSCPKWRQTYPDLTAADLTERSKALQLWNGEDYGFTKRRHTVPVADTCFSDR